MEKLHLGCTSTIIKTYVKSFGGIDVGQTSQNQA